MLWDVKALPMQDSFDEAPLMIGHDHEVQVVIHVNGGSVTHVVATRLTEVDACRVSAAVNASILDAVIEYEQRIKNGQASLEAVLR